MKYIYTFLTLYFLINNVYSQKGQSYLDYTIAIDSSMDSKGALVYRLSDKQAFNVIQKQKIPKSIEKWLGKSIATLPSIDLPKEYTNGYYIFAYTKQKQLIYHFKAYSDLSIQSFQVINKYHIHVFDANGNKIKTGVSLQGKKTIYDETLQAFVAKLPQSKRKILSLKQSNYTLYREVIRSIPYPIYAVKRTPKYQKWSKKEKNIGYIVFNKPKYKPEDSLKFKIYAVNKKGKPYQDTLVISTYIGYPIYKDKELFRLKPNAQGVVIYEGLMPKDLKIDLSYSLDVKTKKKKLVCQNYFRLEDYKLELVNVSFRAEKTMYRRGDTVILLLSVKDANGLAIPNAEAYIKSRINGSGVADYYKNKMMFSLNFYDTTITELGKLYKVKLLPSIFPKVKSGYSFNCTIKTLEGQPKYSSTYFTYDNTYKYIDINQISDSIYISSATKGIAYAELLIKDADLDTLSIQKIALPYAFKLSPNIRYLSTKSGDITNSTTITDWSNISVSTKYHGKYVDIKINNPYKLPIRLTTQRANKILATLVINSSLDTTIFIKKSFVLHHQYYVGGTKRNGQTNLAYNDRKLQLKIDLPNKIFPGETKEIKIKVSDYEGNPVANTDVTLVGINHKFSTTSPYHVDLPNQVINSNFISPKYNYTDNGTPTYAKHKSKDFEDSYATYMLDSLTYYKLTKAPDSIEVRDFKAQNRTPQLAPYIFEDGKQVPVLYVLQGSNLVYLKNTGIDNYTAPLQPSDQQVITIRTPRYRYEIKNLQSVINRVMVLKLNGDSHSSRFSRKRVPQKYTKGEQERLETRLLSISSGERYRYMEHRLIQFGDMIFSQKNDNTLIPKFSNQLNYYGTQQIFYNIQLGSNRSLYINNDDYTTNSWLITPALLSTELKNETPQIKFKELIASIPNDLFRGNVQGRRGFNNWKNQGVFKYTSKKKITNIILEKKGENAHLYGSYQSNIPQGDYTVYFITQNNEYTKRKIKIKHNYLTYLNLDVNSEWQHSNSPNLTDSLLKLKPFIVKHKKFIREIGVYHLDITISDKTWNTRYLSAIITTKNGRTYKNLKVKSPFGLTKTNQQGWFETQIHNQNNNYRKNDIRVDVLDEEVLLIKIKNGNLTLSLEKKENRKRYAQTFTEPHKRFYKKRQKHSRRKNSIGAYRAGGKKMRFRANYKKRSYEWGDEEGYNENNWGSDDLVVKKSIVDGVTYSVTLDNYILTNNNDKVDRGGKLKEKAQGTYDLKLGLAGTVADSVLLSELGEQLRTTFRDDAIWEPSLRTDDSGYVSVSITFPDDITQWDVYAIAGKNQQFGISKTSTKAYKPVMVQLYAPRFMIMGDTAQVNVLLQNNTNSTYDVINVFKVGDKEEKSSVNLKEYIPSKHKVVATKDTMAVSYTTSIATYKDGEERMIPVFPQGMQKSEGIYVPIENDTSIIYKGVEGVPIRVSILNSTLDRYQEQLKNIVKYEYNCNEQLASKLIALSLLKHIANAQGKPFLHLAKAKNIIRKLKKHQNDQGLWGWWGIYRTDLYMSLHVYKAFRFAHQYGLMTDNSFEKQIVQNLYQKYTQGQFSTEQRVVLLQILAEAKLPLNYASEIEQAENILQKNYEEHPIPNRLKLSLIATRQITSTGYNTNLINALLRPDALGNLYIYGGDYDLFGNQIVNTCIAYNILKKDGASAKLKKIEYYLLQHQDFLGWGNTYKSAYALGVLVPNYKPSLKRTKPLLFNGKKIETFPYTTTISNGNQFTFNQVSAPYFIGLYQNFWKTDVKRNDDLFSISTYLSNNKNIATSNFKQKENYTLEVSINVHKQADYVMVSIPIPAGMTYSNKHKNYGEVHREYYKNKVLIYYNKLYVKEYKIRINLYAEFAGAYTINPAKVELMYFPQFMGNNEMRNIQIK